MPQLTFLGAARTVTGSMYLVEVDGRRILVDAGLFQGLKELRLRNWAPLPFDAASLHAVVLTHAHIDHSGRLPLLVRAGYRGRIFCTPGTADLCSLVLPDAGRLQEEDARQANRGGYSKHHPAIPLFTEEDANRTLQLLTPVGYERPVPIAPDVEVEFNNAGHLLGSAFVRMRLAGPPRRQVLFGADLGRYNRPVLPDPVSVSEAPDVLLVESTYGDRVHEEDDRGERLAEVVREVGARGGKLIIPSFAIGRVEEILYWLKRLEDEDRIPTLPVYVDSPMAVEALKFYSDRVPELDAELQPARGPVRAFTTTRFSVVPSSRQSQEIVASRKPAIVISSSGMATGGRVLNHLRVGLADKRNTVLFVGYQSAGTRGRALLDGAVTARIHGEIVPVGARIAKVDSMSAHADSEEMLRWLSGFSSAPGVVYLVHGEPGPMDALKGKIEQRFGWTVRTPAHGDAVAV